MGAKGAMAHRRATVLAFFAGLEDGEFAELMSVVLRPFRAVGLPPGDSMVEDEVLTRNPQPYTVHQKS